MLPAFLITFRESLEAAVIVGILLAILRALKEEERNIFIWGGVGLGIIASLLFAAIFQKFFGGFEGSAEKIYEGFLMIFACILITHMVFWMKKYGHTLQKTLSEKVKTLLVKNEVWAIGFIAFFSVVREGIETVIFFQAIDAQADGGILLSGAILGVVSAIFLATVIFWGVKSVSPKKFLNISGGVLLVIAGGLLAHGIVEFQGANVLPTFIKPLFDLTPLLSEKVGIGAFLKALFGYDANPSLLAIIAYIIFLTGSIFMWRKRRK